MDRFADKCERVGCEKIALESHTLEGQVYYFSANTNGQC